MSVTAEQDVYGVSRGHEVTMTQPNGTDIGSRPIATWWTSRVGENLKLEYGEMSE